MQMVLHKRNSNLVISLSVHILIKTDKYKTVGLTGDKSNTLLLGCSYLT